MELLLALCVGGGFCFILGTASLLCGLAVYPLYRRMGGRQSLKAFLNEL